MVALGGRCETGLLNSPAGGAAGPGLRIGWSPTPPLAGRRRIGDRGPFGRSGRSSRCLLGLAQVVRTAQVPPERTSPSTARRARLTAAARRAKSAPTLALPRTRARGPPGRLALGRPGPDEQGLMGSDRDRPAFLGAGAPGRERAAGAGRTERGQRVPAGGTQRGDPAGRTGDGPCR